MPIHISPCEDITMKNIKELTFKGHPIIATPHIGNYTRHHMAYPQMNVQLRSLEQNQSGRDPIFTPELLKIQKKIISLTGESTKNVLSPYLTFQQNYSPVTPIDAASPAELHYKTMGEVIGEKYNLLTADYFLNEDAYKIFEILIKHGIEVFDREVSEEGVVDKNTSFLSPDHAITEYINLMKQHIALLTGNNTAKKTGPILSNKLCIFTDILQYFKKNPNADKDIYMVSGQSMIHYTKSASFVSELNRYFKIIRESMIIPSLPEELQIHMIPGSGLSFLPTEKETQMIELIQEIIATFHKRKQHILEVSQLCKTEDPRHIRNNSVIHSKIQERDTVSKKLLSLKKEFQELHTAQTVFTQHDSYIDKIQIAHIDALQEITFKDIFTLFHT